MGVYLINSPSYVFSNSSQLWEQSSKWPDQGGEIQDHDQDSESKNKTGKHELAWVSK